TEKEVPSEDDEQLDDGEKHGPNVTTTVYSDGTVEQRLVEDRESVSGTETVRSRRSGDFPSDISETPVQKLVILADSDSTKPKHSAYVFKLTDTRQDEVLAFCNRVEEILKPHPGITLPPMNQMWGTVFNKVLGMIRGGPGIIGSSTNQDYIKATLRKLQVINGVENKFRAFLIKASRISDEMGGSIVAMDQATDYVTRWQTLYSETLGSGRLQPDQSREAVDVFIEGIKPVGFRDK
ncbi:hypothetical protein ADUPG1_005860, partial [Aduncisulcus paluster]